ncbi:MAG TPA: hypothetical protein VHW72_16440 [Candidatus Angelobacter sp.]|jgi:hypothetical protein|nr:hypothetical protein [Candidatus Angelobacter sp.]
MKHRSLSLCALLLLACGLAAAQSPVPAADSKKVVEKARQSYYNLRAAGLDEFRATIKPNWSLVLKDQLKADPEKGEAAVKLLNGLHFSMLLDKDGKVTVTHRTDTEPANEQQRQGFDQIYSGLDQAITGFFTTWSVFMLSPPLPAADSVYQLEDLGVQYRISYKDGDSDVITTMGKNMIITEVKVNSKDYVSSVRPQLTRTAKGFVLSGYTADYTPTSGKGVVKLDLKIQNQLVSGLQLPANLVLDSVLDGEPTHMELALSEHQVTSH